MWTHGGLYCRCISAWLDLDELTCRDQVNTLRPRQNGAHFPDDILKWISWIKIYEFRLKISLLKFVPRGSINNIPTLVQIMAWRRPGDKPLSEPMVARLLMHICVTWPQWVNLFNSQYHDFWCSGSLCREVISSLSYMMKDFNYLCHVNVDQWHKMKIHVNVSSEKFSR